MGTKCPKFFSTMTVSLPGRHSGVVRSHQDRGSKQSSRVKSTDPKSRSSGTHTGPTKSRTTAHRGYYLIYRSRFSGTHTGPTKSGTTAPRGSLTHRSRFSGTHTGPTKSRTLVTVLLALLLTSVRGATCDVCGNSASSNTPNQPEKRALCSTHKRAYTVWRKGKIAPTSVRRKRWKDISHTDYLAFVMQACPLATMGAHLHSTVRRLAQAPLSFETLCQH